MEETEIIYWKQPMKNNLLYNISCSYMILDKYEITFPPLHTQLYNISYECPEPVVSLWKSVPGNSIHIRYYAEEFKGLQREEKKLRYGLLGEAGHSFILPKSLVTQNFIPEWDLQI